MLLTNCQELDFLDPNGPSLEQTTVQTLVSGIEGGMRNDFEFYIRSMSVIGREAYYLEPSDPRYTGELLGKNGSLLDPSGFLLVRSWASRYRVIRNCNILLDLGGGDAGVAGFAKTITAYQLLLNLNMTDVNGVRVDVAGEAPGPFLTKDASLAAVEALLNDGFADLQAAGTAFSFTLSSGFSLFDTPAEFAMFNRAIKARVDIYQEDYQSALDALAASFMDAAGDLNAGAYHVYGTGSGDVANNPVYEDPQATSIKLFAHPSFLTDAEAGDTRVSGKTIVRSDPTTLDGLTSDVGQTLTSGPTAPFPIIRNEELLLLHAEANIGLNNLGAAETDINIVRNAAGLASVTLGSQTAATDELLRQRRYSLFLEGHRWVDVRRYDRLSTLPIDRAGDLVHSAFPRPSDEI
jgi:hypothetical protein